MNSCFAKGLTQEQRQKTHLTKFNGFFEERDIQLKHVIGVCTDGALSMLGCRSGFQTSVKETSPNVVGTQLLIASFTVRLLSYLSTFEKAKSGDLQANSIAGKFLPPDLLSASTA